MSGEPLFDPSLKKRKKKQVAFSEDPLGADADPTTPAPATIDNVTTNGDTVDMGPTTAHEQMLQQNGNGAGNDDESKIDEDAMFADLKKKKKKKKDIPMDLPDEESGTSTPVGAPSAAAAGGGSAEDLDFSDLKKKKKKSKKAALDMEAFEKELNEAKAKDGEDADADGAPIDEVDEAELGDDPFARGGGAGAGEVVVVDAGSEAWLGSDRDYTYAELLRRFYAQLHASNPALLNTAGKRHTLAPPQLGREGNKKTVFGNVADICKRMHRQPEHAIQFMFAELGTTGSIDGSGRLIIRGRFSQPQIENVIRRYIVEYVTCKTCKSPDTLLVKENRIFFVACESCGSRRSVNAIKTGFQAQVGRRSKNKTG